MIIWAGGMAGGLEETLPSIGPGLSYLQYSNLGKTTTLYRSEGLPERDIRFLGVMPQRLSQTHRVLGTLPPPSPPSFGPNMSKSAISSKLIFPEIPGDIIFRNESPCGSFPQKVTFSELTSRE